MNIRGFTLIEMIITLAIFAAAMSAIAGLYIGFLHLTGYQNSAAGLARTFGTVASAAERTIGPANAVLASHEFAEDTFSSGTTTVVVEIPSIDVEGKVIESSYDYAVLYQDATDLYLLVEPEEGSVRRAGTVLLTQTLDSISFTYNDPDFAAVTAVTVEFTARMDSATSTLSEVLRLRNHL